MARKYRGSRISVSEVQIFFCMFRQFIFWAFFPFWSKSCFLFCFGGERSIESRIHGSVWAGDFFLDSSSASSPRSSCVADRDESSSARAIKDIYALDIWYIKTNENQITRKIWRKIKTPENRIRQNVDESFSNLIWWMKFRHSITPTERMDPRSDQFFTKGNFRRRSFSSRRQKFTTSAKKKIAKKLFHPFLPSW